MVVAKGAVRTARAAVASMESWSRRGMPSGETPARSRPPYVRWCPARVKGPPARLSLMHLWVAMRGWRWGIRPVLGSERPAGNVAR